MTNRIDNAISRALGISDAGHEIVEVVEGEVMAPVPDAVDPRAAHEDEDYELARKNLRELIATAKTALDSAIRLAKDNEKPEQWKAVATMTKEVADLSTKLYDLQERAGRVKQLKDPPKKEEDAKVNIEKAVFVGDTTEMLRALKEAKKAITNGN